MKSACLDKQVSQTNRSVETKNITDKKLEMNHFKLELR